MKDIILDANNAVAGRLASVAARYLMKGSRVTIINAGNAVITGRPEAVRKLYAEKVERGDPYHGPFYPREPTRILKRIVRGMINYHQARGKAAFKQLRVYTTSPALTSTPVKSPETLNTSLKHIKLSDLSASLGK